MLLASHLTENKIFVCAATYRSIRECLLHDGQILHRHPALPDKALLGNVHVEQVEGVVDGLHFPHHDAPVLQLFGNINQDALAMVLSLVQHQIQILQAGPDPVHHLVPFGACVGTRIEGGVETAADFFYAGLELFALEEGGEDGLVHFISLHTHNKIVDRLVKNITAIIFYESST